jgi:hypothetical protein
MTRWIGFVLGAALALAAVHRLGVCDLAPLPDHARAMGRAILDRVPTEREARTVPNGGGGAMVPERQAGTAGETAESAEGGDDGPSQKSKAETVPAPLAASRPRLPSEGKRLVNEQVSGPTAGIQTDSGGRETDREVGSTTDDAPAVHPAPGPGSGVADAGLFSDQPEGAAATPRVRTSQDAPDKGFSPAGEQASLPATSIWAPFRSRRSAEGFAEHLHKRFGSDLEVRQAGPGVYGVYLTAATEDELADGLARLRSAGALPGPEARR